MNKGKKIRRERRSSLSDCPVALLPCGLTVYWVGSLQLLQIRDILSNSYYRLEIFSPTVTIDWRFSFLQLQQTGDILSYSPSPRGTARASWHTHTSSSLLLLTGQQCIRQRPDESLILSAFLSFWCVSTSHSSPLYWSSISLMKISCL